MPIWLVVPFCGLPIRLNTWPPFPSLCLTTFTLSPALKMAKMTTPALLMTWNIIWGQCGGMPSKRRGQDALGHYGTNLTRPTTPLPKATLHHSLLPAYFRQSLNLKKWDGAIKKIASLPPNTFLPVSWKSKRQHIALSEPSSWLWLFLGSGSTHLWCVLYYDNIMHPLVILYRRT